MKANWIMVSGLFLAAAGSVVRAQDYQGTGFWEGPSYGRSWAYPYGGNGWGYGGFGGTYEGSLLSGLGSFYRGAGEYKYNSALAARELELARQQSIKNHKLAVENWVALRKAHQDRRQAHWEKEKLTPDEVARIVESNRPDRLAPSQYEPATGMLRWPAALLGKEFAEERDALDALFAERTGKDAGADSLFYHEVRRLTAAMIAKLGDKSSELAPMQLIAAKKFLVGLKYESLLPMDIKALAAGE